MRDFPVVLMGRAYWAGLLHWMRERMLAEGKIDAGDLELFTVTDDPAEVVEVMAGAAVRQVRRPRAETDAAPKRRRRSTDARRACRRADGRAGEEGHARPLECAREFAVSAASRSRSAASLLPAGALWDSPRRARGAGASQAGRAHGLVLTGQVIGIEPEERQLADVVEQAAVSNSSGSAHSAWPSRRLIPVCVVTA